MSGRLGYTLAELMVVLAIIGIVSAATLPMFVTFLRARETRGASQELATLLNQARQLAIARNEDYRVEIDVPGNRLRVIRTANNAAWIGPGTDDQGFRRLQNLARLTCASADPTFTSLGTAGGGTIAVQNAQGSSTMYVVVSPSGRIRQCDATGGCPSCP